VVAVVVTTAVGVVADVTVVDAVVKVVVVEVAIFVVEAVVIAVDFVLQDASNTAITINRLKHNQITLFFIFPSIFINHNDLAF
jgi:hypothetical protein